MTFMSMVPRALFELARAAAGQAVESAAALSTLPVRVFRVLDSTELLVNRITLIAGQAEALIARTGLVIAEAEAAVARTGMVITEAEAAVGRTVATTGAAALTVQEAGAVAAAAAAVVEDARLVSRGAAAVVDQAAGTAGTADGLLEAYAPALRTAAPMAQEFVRQLTPAEVSAAIRIVDRLPQLLDHLDADILPILATLEKAGPDVHALLDATRDLKLAIIGIPGMKMLRRRGEEREDEEAEED